MRTSSSLPHNLEPKDNGNSIPPDDGGKDPGEALSKFDFSHLDPGSHIDLESQGPDHSDAYSALASMSSDDALDYAISQMGPADHLPPDHLDAGHFDVGVPVDTSHDA